MDENTPATAPEAPPVEVKPAVTAAEVTAAIRDVFTTTIALVAAAEAAIPEKGKGKEKLQKVLAGAQAYAPLVGLTLGLVETLAPMLEAFVGRIVKRFNSFGWPKLTPPSDPQ